MTRQNYFSAEFSTTACVYRVSYTGGIVEIYRRLIRWDSNVPACVRSSEVYGKLEDCQSIGSYI